MVLDHFRLWVRSFARKPAARWASDSARGRRQRCGLRGHFCLRTSPLKLNWVHICIFCEQVDNVQWIVDHAKKQGAKIVTDVHDENDEFGTVKMASLQTVPFTNTHKNRKKNHEFSTGTHCTLWWSERTIRGCFYQDSRPLWNHWQMCWPNCPTRTCRSLTIVWGTNPIFRFTFTLKTCSMI